MTRAEVEAHLKRANVQGEWEDVLTRDLCQSLLSHMDRVEELEGALGGMVGLVEVLECRGDLNRRNCVPH